MDSKRLGLVHLHLAILLFGGTALFAKLIDLPALDITAYRSAIACITLLLLLVLFKKPVRLKERKDYAIALCLGVLVGIHWVTYFAAMQLAGVTIGIIALFTYPVITVFIEPFFHGARPQLKDIGSACVVLFGIYLLVPSGNVGGDISLGILVGVVSACFFASRNVLHKRYFAAYSGMHAMYYQTLVASAMLIAFVEVPTSSISSENLWLLLLVGTVFTAAPHALFASSLQHLSAATAGLISCLQPLYGSLFAILLLSERPSMMTMIGGTLVISAACFETWSQAKKGRS